jgi:SAM-dependent methyltransferase
MGRALAASAYTDEFFRARLAGSYASAQRIVPLVLDLVPARSVLDVGCATGHFLRAFAEAGIDDFLGIDGDYVPRHQLAIDERRFRAVDLAAGFDLGRRFDLVISLEVAEHLPRASADRFVASLARHGSTILFSAAIPFQGGDGHLNEQWPSYWAERFERHGYRAYDVVRPALWGMPEVEWWYRQNAVLFCDEAGHAASARLAACAPVGAALLDRVHPEAYLIAQGAAQDRLRRMERAFWRALAGLNITSGALRAIDARLFGGRMRRVYYALRRYLAGR